MRKLINSTYITLDGLIQNLQNWPSMGGFSAAGKHGPDRLCRLAIPGG